MKRFFLFALFAVFFFAACKSQPVPSLPEPYGSFRFDNIRADDPENLTLEFTLTISNPIPLTAAAKIESWYVTLNGRGAETGFALACRYPGMEIFAVNPGTPENPGTVSVPFFLEMDVAALTTEGIAPADEYSVNLTAEMSFAFDSEDPLRAEVSGLAVFPAVQAPVFSITSIAVLKAELVNTRFRVGLKIVNPNPYPVELSAFIYELYGNGRLWADGSERNIITVDGKSTLEGNLFLVMNFINMKRDLFDQIVNLQDVAYRFAGEANVKTGVDYLPVFKTGFDLSGFSRVFDN